MLEIPAEEKDACLSCIRRASAVWQKMKHSDLVSGKIHCSFFNLQGRHQTRVQYLTQVRGVGMVS